MSRSRASFGLNPTLRKDGETMGALRLDEPDFNRDNFYDCPSE
jgi:hypothetical protein